MTPKPSGSTLHPMMSSVSGQSFSPARLDLRRAAVSGAQNDRRGAVAEQAGGNDVGLGQFVVAHSERAEFERDQQHVGAGPRLREPRCDRQARHAAGASQAEYRHARHVGTKAELAGDPRLERRRRDTGRTHRDDGVDIRSRRDRRAPIALRATSINRISAPSRKACVRSGQPRRSSIPFHRFDAVTMADPGVGKQAGKRFELRIALSHHTARCFEDLRLVKLMWWHRGRQRNQRGRIDHNAVPASRALSVLIKSEPGSSLCFDAFS